MTFMWIVGEDQPVSQAHQRLGTFVAGVLGVAGTVLVLGIYGGLLP